MSNTPVPKTRKTSLEAHRRIPNPFARSITLPAGVESDNIEANHEAGVLTIYLPKAEEIKPRKIAIKAGEGHKVIEAGVISKD